MADPIILPDVSELSYVAYLFGYPISHSLSPLFHRTIFQNIPSLPGPRAQLFYESKSIPDFLETIKSPKFFGASVTMPHKVAIIPYLDELTPAGRAIGAVNTIYLKQAADGSRILCGTNTDCIGIRSAIANRIGDAQVAARKGRPGLVIGGGGTCRAAVYALRVLLGCGTIYLVNRDKSEVDAVIEQCITSGFGEDLVYVQSEAQAKSLEAPGMIVSAIPDFEPVSDEEKLARRIVEIILEKEEKGPLLEMCYHPSPDTRIARLATQLGWDVVPGVEAMIYQGLEQDVCWLGLTVDDLPVDKVKEVVHAAITKGH